MKYLLLIITIFLSTISFSQTKLGLAFKNPKESLKSLSYTEKSLLYECISIMGTSLDSLQGVEDIYNTPQFVNLNVKAVVRSDYFFVDPISNQKTNCAVETNKITPKLMKPRYMVFVMRNEEGSKVTLQQYR